MNRLPGTFPAAKCTRAGMRGTAAIVIALAGCGSDPGPPADATGSTTSTPGSEATSAPATASTSTSSADPTTTAAPSTGTESSSSTGDPWTPPPDCDSFDYDWRGMVAGPAAADFDADLETTARKHDRLHVALGGAPHGMASDMGITLDDADARAAIQAFLDDDDAWEIDAPSVVATWGKATGAFAGVAAAADAYRYGTMRDQGYPCEEIERAREQLVTALDGLHLSTAITGVPGIVARAYAHLDYPGVSESSTTPLFDGNGDPLPEIKNNGTWRDDASGDHGDFVWEDSCSRDQLVGWAAGYGAAWEVIEHDPTFDDALKDRMREDAAAIARQLMTVRESGYDLEIFDADGRTTLHGYLHEENIEGMYLGIWNGFHALMAAGIVGALAYIADDAEIDAYLHDELLDERNLMGIAVFSMLIDFGAATNYSNYNMAFDAAWLSLRYLGEEGVREDLRTVVQELYASEGEPRQPIENAQSFFDFVYAATVADASALAPTPNDPDEDAIAQGLDTLRLFPVPPSYTVAVENCDADEIAAGVCTLLDGTETTLLGTVGHNDQLVAEDTVPIDIRPISNFYWRSNPYSVNGSGTGEGLGSSADFRFAYWLGRWTRR